MTSKLYSYIQIVKLTLTSGIPLEDGNLGETCRGFNSI
jgi:hypothetical protein